MKTFSLFLGIFFSCSHILNAQDTINFNLSINPSGTKGQSTKSVSDSQISTLVYSLTDKNLLLGLPTETRGIGQSVNLNFLKVATRYEQGDSVVYKLRVIEIDGKSAGILADLFLPQDTKVILEYLNGEVIKEFRFDINKFEQNRIMSNLDHNEFIIRLVCLKTVEPQIKLTITKLIYIFPSKYDEVKRKINKETVNHLPDPYGCGYVSCFPDYASQRNKLD